jgi:predicted RNA-binding protein YlqC (UPF0109 family)
MGLQAQVEEEHFSEDQAEEDPLPDHELLEEILLKVVSQPEQLRVFHRRTERLGRGAVNTLTIRVAQQDFGRVLGKKGEMMALLRSLFGRIAAARHEWVEIDLVGNAHPNRLVRPTSFRRHTGVE